MGTRCLTVLHDGEKEIAVLYRQFDGYPDGHGKELADFLKGKTIVNGIGDEDKSKIFNGMGCLAANVVAHFKKKVGGIYLHPAGTRDVWEDYIYHVRGEIGKEPEIEMDEFSGYASEFQAFLDKMAEQD